MGGKFLLLSLFLSYKYSSQIKINLLKGREKKIERLSVLELKVPAASFISQINPGGAENTTQQS